MANARAIFGCFGSDEGVTLRGLLAHQGQDAIRSIVDIRLWRSKWCQALR
jgi:hypothetical protein